ncbi:hypothetical protein E1212_06085 [Jiangella ureilytica]|uniref:Uncharacterized protein n=1 Tax=Jiangella ureilytica TaxID=2530374 RepID=A0A4R4RT69_9ACTN|nr:hypothetical protein [Jiangella ureilytica]TDC53237.1 hypothetical protein E1212_06085 [Jiangella ureilytica]
MDTLYMVAVQHDLLVRQSDTPERRHLAAALAAREPWRLRLRLRRLRLPVGPPPATMAARGPTAPRP